MYELYDPSDPWDERYSIFTYIYLILFNTTKSTNMDVNYTIPLSVLGN